MWVQRPLDIDLFATLRATLDYFQVVCYGPALLVIHRPSLLVAHPSVGTSSSRVHPHDVVEAKVVSQSHINNFDGHGHELPAFVADSSLVTACSNVVVISQIDIEAELL